MQVRPGNLIVVNEPGGFAQGRDRPVERAGLVENPGHGGEHFHPVGMRHPVEMPGGDECPLVEASGLVIGVDLPGAVARHPGETPGATPTFGVEVVQREDLGKLLRPTPASGEGRVAHLGMEPFPGLVGKPVVGHVTDQRMLEIDPPDLSTVRKPESLRTERV